MLRLIKMAIIVTFLLCYPGFGHDGGGMIAGIEWLLVSDMNALQESLTNPFVWFAFAGQLLIIISLFRTSYPKQFAIAGIICLWLVAIPIIILDFATGFLSALSVVPFAIATVFYFSKISLEEKTGSG